MELNKVDLNKLHTFFSVVENHGIAGASKQLLLTRSAISQSISGLEKNLELKLFHRVGKKLLLTGEGKRLYRSFQEYQKELHRTLNDIVDEKREVKGLIRIGSFYEFSKTVLTDFLSSFLERNPGVQIKLLFSSPSELNSLLQKNKIDLAFSVYPQSDTLISSTPLFREELVLVSGPRYFRKALGFSEIKKLPVIDYYQNSIQIKRWLKHHYGKKSTDLNVKTYAASADLVLHFILNNAGVGVVPKYLAEPFLAAGQLKEIKGQKEPLIDYIWLNELKSTYKNRAYETFKADVIRELSNI